MIGTEFYAFSCTQPPSLAASPTLTMKVDPIESKRLVKLGKERVNQVNTPSLNYHIPEPLTKHDHTQSGRWHRLSWSLSRSIKPLGLGSIQTQSICTNPIFICFCHRIRFNRCRRQCSECIQANSHLRSNRITALVCSLSQIQLTKKIKKIY